MITLAADEVTASPVGPTTPSGKTAWPDPRVVRHWLPWALPVLAILLPLACFAMAASVHNSTWTWGPDGTSVGRGDLLIPALIVCAEALRRWWFEVRGGPIVWTLALAFTLVCGTAVIMCLVAFAEAANNPVAEHGSWIIGVVTWASFTAGLVAGTIAVALTIPPKAGS
jgi:hypothetical protein